MKKQKLILTPLDCAVIENNFCKSWKSHFKFRVVEGCIQLNVAFKALFDLHRDLPGSTCIKYMNASAFMQK